MLKFLGVEEAYAESDGFHSIEVFLNVRVPKEDFDLLKVPVVLAIAEKMPLVVWVEDPHGHLGKLVWVDEEYLSLSYSYEEKRIGISGYNVWKRAEVNLR